MECLLEDLQTIYANFIPAPVSTAACADSKAIDAQPAPSLSDFREAALHLDPPRVERLHINACPQLRLQYDELRNGKVYELVQTSDRVIDIIGQTDPSRLATPDAASRWFSSSDFIAQKHTLRPRGAGMSLQRVSISQCAKLQSTTLLGCPKVTTFTIQRCKELKQLVLQYNDQLSAVSLAACSALAWVRVELCNSLPELDLTGCNQVNKVEIQACEALTRVSLGYSKHLSLLGLADAPALRELIVGDLGSVDELDLSRCVALEVLHVEHCSKLHTLLMGKCTALQIVHLQECDSLCTMRMASTPNLAEMHLHGCHQLTALPPEVSHCKQLTHLSITGGQISEVTLRSPVLAILRLVRCVQLEQLRLGNHSMAFPALPDTAGKAAQPVRAERLSLQELDVRLCKKLQTLPDIFSCTPDLQQVKLRGTDVYELPPSFASLEDKVLDPDSLLSTLQRDMAIARSRSDASRYVSALLMTASLTGLGVVSDQLSTDLSSDDLEVYARGVRGSWDFALGARVVWMLTALAALSSLAVATWLMYRIDAAKGIQQVFRHRKLHRHFKFVLKMPEQLVLVTLTLSFIGMMLTAANYAKEGWSAMVFAVVFVTMLCVILVWAFLELGWRPETSGPRSQAASARTPFAQRAFAAVLASPRRNAREAIERADTRVRGSLQLRAWGSAVKRRFA